MKHTPFYTKTPAHTMPGRYFFVFGAYVAPIVSHAENYDPENKKLIFSS